MNLIAEIERVLRKKKELEAKREQLLKELSELKPEEGHLEYKPVKNKIGMTYYYWYLRIYENGKLKSVYLGKEIPQAILKGIEDRRKAKKINSELRAINRELVKIERGLREIENILSKL